MYLSIRRNANGTAQYRFTYVDAEGKRRRFPQKDVPPFASEEEARAWAKSQQAIHSARKATIAAKLAWKDRHYQFSELVETYRRWQTPR